MMITPANLQVLYTTFSNLYQSAYDGYTPWYTDVATVVPSGSKSNTYGWMQKIMAVRQWVGPRVLNNIAASSYVLPNLLFENTIAVDRSDIEDDSLGVYSPSMAQLGESAAMWPDIQLAQMLALNAGLGPIGFDGLTFFHAAHPLDPGGNQSNSTNLALTAPNYAIVRAAMLALRGENSQPLYGGAMPKFLMVVPPQLDYAARVILNAEFIAVEPTAGTTAASQYNVLRNSAQLLTIPQLAADPTRWYLFVNSMAIKPLVWQLRRSPTLVPLVRPDDPNVFWQNEYVYGVDMRGAAGVSTWWLAYTSKP